MNESPNLPFTSTDRRSFEHLIRRLLARPNPPAVLMLHHWGWWNSGGDGVDRGLFYFRPESDLTLFSNVSGQAGRPASAAAAPLPCCVLAIAAMFELLCGQAGPSYIPTERIAVCTRLEWFVYQETLACLPPCHPAADLEAASACPLHLFPLCSTTMSPRSPCAQQRGTLCTRVWRASRCTRSPPRCIHSACIWPCVQQAARWPCPSARQLLLFLLLLATPCPGAAAADVEAPCLAGWLQVHGVFSNESLHNFLNDEGQAVLGTIPAAANADMKNIFFFDA